MTVASLVMALCAVIGTAVNSFGWNRHARKDDGRFSDVDDRINGGS